MIDERVATLPGLDGRKMSKSYDNIIPLFAGGERALREAVLRIVTDSRSPGEPKDPESNALYPIFRAFASEEEADEFAEALREGLSWGAAKVHLIAKIEAELAPLRARYAEWMSRPERIEEVLAEGRARRAPSPPHRWRRRRRRRGFAHPGFAPAPLAKKQAQTGPRLKQYREADGFFFKLEDGAGRVLLRGGPFADPRQAASVLARLKATRHLDAESLRLLAEGVSAAEAEQALASLHDG